MKLLDYLPGKLDEKEMQGKIMRVCEENDIVFLALFGSYARREQTKNSDIDMILKFDQSKEKSLLDLIHIENEFSKLFEKKVDLLTQESISPYLKDTITKSMRVIYEKQ